MLHLLRLTGVAVERRPGRVLLGLLAATVVLGGFASQQSTDTDLTAFAPAGELAETLEEVQTTFSAGGVSVQVVIDAGDGGDVLTPEVLEATDALVDQIAADDLVVSALAERESAVSSFSGAAQDPEASQAMASLLSQEYSSDVGTARAGLVVVELDPDLSLDATAEAELRVADIVNEASMPSGVAADAIGQNIIAERLQADSEDEMGGLLGLSLLLIVVILALQFRRASDVILGLVGLVVSITWLFGFGVLLGPDYLGLVGAFTQVSIIIPVLLVGLGVDYAIHLNSRYREERRHGLTAGRSANAAVRTVGGALVLATAATVLGFLTNLISPLPPLADFGIFTAVGVISAFVVMTLLVPSARNLLDTRRARRTRTWGASQAEVGPRVGALARVMGSTSVIAERAPKAALGVALALTLLATIGASQIETRFSQDDFIPEESEIGQLLAAIESQFGGDIAEATYVVVDGDITDPALFNRMAALAIDLVDVPDVRVADGAAQVQSPVSALTTLAESDPALAGAFADLGFDPATGADPEADLATVFRTAFDASPVLMSTVVTESLDTSVVSIGSRAGQDRASDLETAVVDATAPLRDAGAGTRVTSEFLVLEDTLDALTASQAQGIAFTLIAALLLLASYYGIVERRPLIGVITMVPSVAVVSWVLGTMWLLGYSFNVLTAMVASIGIGIGVPFGIHITHRFLEDRRRYDTIDEAISQTLTHTGGAMAGSAATTAAGFGVLVFASLIPIQQFGTIVAITILYSLAAAVLVQPSCLKLWAEWRARQGDVAELEETDDHRVLEPV
ncbi:MAG: efflux RND transporter permease subunit [Acidimicrobiales bacterium]